MSDELEERDKVKTVDIRIDDEACLQRRTDFRELAMVVSQFSEEENKEHR